MPPAICLVTEFCTRGEVDCDAMTSSSHHIIISSSQHVIIISSHHLHFVMTSSGSLFDFIQTHRTAVEERTASSISSQHASSSSHISERSSSLSFSSSSSPHPHPPHSDLMSSLLPSPSSSASNPMTSSMYNGNGMRPSQPPQTPFE